MADLLKRPVVRIGLICAVVGVMYVLWAPVAHATRAISNTTPLWDITFNWFTAILVLVAVARAGRFLGIPPLASMFDRTSALRDVLLGSTLGALLCSLVIGVLAANGAYRIESIHIKLGLAVLAIAQLPGVITQELIYRGFAFSWIESKAGTWLALTLSTAIFAVVHATNPAASWVSTLASAAGGLLFGAAFIASRTLWLPISIHFAWNFLEGPVFGTPVSGATPPTSAIASEVAGHSMLTGGDFGPEAGLPTVIVVLATAAAFLIIAWRRDRFKPFRRVRDG